MPTLSCPEVPPCTLVLLTECRRKSLPWLHPPLRSRSLPHQKGNTPSGSEARSWLPCPPSNRCGFQSKNTTNQVPELSTANAFRRPFFMYLNTLNTVQLYISYYYTTIYLILHHTITATPVNVNSNIQNINKCPSSIY
jgi:hypothetical protein